jgi:hypothetical protein
MACTRSSIVLFAGLSLLSIGCKQPARTPTSADGTGPSKVESPKASVPTSLDLIVMGPFAFIEKGSSLEIWIPELKGHNKPHGQGVGETDERLFEKAEYDFTHGIEASQTSKLTLPVRGASAYQLSRKGSNLSYAPKKRPYMLVKLPTPREIIPWNADPVQITARPKDPKTVSPELLATAVILRFDYKVGDLPQMTAAGQPTWTPHPIDLGTERIVLLGANPPYPLPNEEEHRQARIAFQRLTALLGVKLNIEFPVMDYTRNQPLTSGVLPDDLIKVLYALSQQIRSQAFSLSSVDIIAKKFGKTNDCKSVVILVTP